MLEEKDGNLQDPVGKEGLNSENETTQEEQTSQEDPQSEIDHSNAEDAEPPLMWCRRIKTQLLLEHLPR